MVIAFSMPIPVSIRRDPNSIDNILAWQSLNPDTKQKLFWGNATRFFKGT